MILILSPFFSPNTGGVETHLDDLVAYLVKKNYHVTVITYKPLTTRAKSKILERSEGLTIWRIPWYGKTLFHRFEDHPVVQFLYLTPGLLIGTFIFFVVKHREITAVHAHGFTAALITNFVNKFYHGARLVVSMHAIYRLGERDYLAFICRHILKPFDKIFCLAETSKQDLADAGIDNRKLDIYVQWVDQNNFQPRNQQIVREQLGLGNKFTCLFVGRLIEKKGVEIIARVATKMPTINFVFVGDGPWYSRGLALSKKFKNIILVGKQAPNKTAKYYNAVDVTLVPSQYEEGFARVVLETLFSGTPLLASKKGCLPEMIRPSVGVLIEPTSSELYKYLKYFSEHPDKLTQLKNNCRSYAIARFSVKHAELIERSYLTS